MQVRISQDAPAHVRTGALVVPVFSDHDLDGATAEVDALLDGAIADAVKAGEMKGKIGETVFLHAKDQPFRRVLAVGLGESGKCEPQVLARYAGTAVRYLGRRNIKEIALTLPVQSMGQEEACASFLTEGAIAGSFETTVYQEKPDKHVVTESIALLAHGLDQAAVKRGVERGTILGEAVNVARMLAITPANDMTPTHLADAASKLAKESGVEISILDEKDARKEGMGAFLSVAQGSVQPPKVIVMTYKGDPKSKEILGLVGKGITFDTGGISLKPPERMEEMKYDMSGGAGVIAVMAAIGKLKPKVNVIGIVPATENMPGGKATKPGDIVKSMNGKTIEVINTDAEGRLILCDGLTYAKKLRATKLIDTATLTGACVIALGHAASAAVTNDDAWVNEFLAAAKHTGERYWHMPYYEEYSTAMKSEIADLKNTGGRAAGTLTAGAFLRAFVGDTPWIHLDIAGTAYVDTETAWQAKGPTGTPVRALVALIEALGSSHASSSNGSAKKAAVAKS
jgi:leucyl aminopeptidase